MREPTARRVRLGTRSINWLAHYLLGLHWGHHHHERIVPSRRLRWSAFPLRLYAWEQKCDIAIYGLLYTAAAPHRRRGAPMLTVCVHVYAVDVLTQTYKHSYLSDWVVWMGWVGVVLWWGGVTMVIWNIWYVGRALVGCFSVYWIWNTRVYTFCVNTVGCGNVVRAAMPTNSDCNDEYEWWCW